MNARKVALYTAVVIIVALAFEFLFLVRNVLFLIFLSILLATAIEPIVNRLRRGPFNRGFGILLVYTFIMGIIALTLFFTLPPLVDEGSRILAGFNDENKTNAAIRQSLGQGFLADTALNIYSGVRGALRNPDTVNTGLSLGMSIFEILFSTITVFVIAFYWLTERPVIKRFTFSFVPEEKRPRGRVLWDSVEGKLGAWVRGQVLLMLFIFAADLIGYSVMGLKFAFALAVFAALAEIIPLIGPYVGGAPALLLALTQRVDLAIAVAVFIVVIQLIEGNVLVPRIMERAVGVSPLTVIVGLLVGSTLYGILGALLAVPVAAAIQVVINNLLSFSADDTSAQQAAVSATNTHAALVQAAAANEKEREQERVHRNEPGGPAPVI